MAARIESLACPGCGAPLHPEAGRTLTVCLYCGATVRVQLPDEAPTQLAVERQLAPADLEAVRQELAAGRPDAARALYRQLTGAEEVEALAAVEDLGRQAALTVVFRQLLNPLGLALSVAGVVGLVAALAGWGAGWLPNWLALLVGGAAALHLAFMARPALTTLRYLPAPIAPAVIVKLAPIGTLQQAGDDVFTFRALLEVRPETAAAFQAEIPLAVREASLAKARAGATVRVKYFPGDPGSVIFFDRPGA